MKGLILKDLIIIKNNFKKIYLVILLFSILPGFQNKDYFLTITTFIISMLLASQVIAGITVDENNGWNKAVLSMPISIQKIVLSKYILTLLFSVISAIMLSLTGEIAKVLLDLEEYAVFLSVIEGFLLGIIFNGINIPVTYRYGAEASKYFMLLFISVPVILVYVFYFLHIDTNQIIVWVIKNKFFTMLGCIVGMIFLMCCSIKVSIASYRNRL